MSEQTIQFEARIIEQEHRLYRVLVNFFSETKGLPELDPRRKAAKSALIWQLVPSGGQATFAVGGMLAIVTLFFTAQQSRALQEQNALLQKQDHIAEIKYFWERRAQLLSYLYDAEKGEPKFNSRIRSEALVEFLKIERFKADKNLSQIGAKNTEQKVATLSYGIDLEGAMLSGIALNQIDFHETYLPEANMQEASLFGCDFTNAQLDHANLMRADLTETIFSPISLLGTNLMFANMQSVKGWNKVTAITLANIHGIKNAPDGFRSWAITHGAVDEPDMKRWQKMKTQRLSIMFKPK
ncbi:MAG: pentapeptide repeat-containing protein [Gallionellaceae bacterium]